MALRDAAGESLVTRLVAQDGSAAHPWHRRLMLPRADRRDLADAVHGLCLLHGNFPGLADDALAHGAAFPAALPLLAMLSASFTAERAAIAAIVAGAGPLPSTPGQGASDTAILTQRHALATLAASGRTGCAIGAVVALTLDWAAVRTVLDVAADRFAVAAEPPALPDAAEVTAGLAALATTPAIVRAIHFGADQCLAQQRGLWSLLEARAAARG